MSDRESLRKFVDALAQTNLRHILKQLPTMYADGAEPGVTAKPRGRQEPVE